MTHIFHSLFACNRSRLTGFLLALKRADEHLAFVFVTGTTKLPWTSVSGGLNQLRDISWERDFADVCGITEDELLATFAPKIEARASRLDLSSGGCLKALRDSYDGYCFHPDGPMGPDGPLESHKVYNPPQPPQRPREPTARLSAHRVEHTSLPRKAPARRTTRCQPTHRRHHLCDRDAPQLLRSRRSGPHSPLLPDGLPHDTRCRHACRRIRPRCSQRRGKARTPRVPPVRQGIRACRTGQSRRPSTASFLR